MLYFKHKSATHTHVHVHKTNIRNNKTKILKKLHFITFSTETRIIICLKKK